MESTQKEQLKNGMMKTLKNHENNISLPNNNKSEKGTWTAIWGSPKTII